MEDDRARGGGVEHAIDDDTVEVQVVLRLEPKRWMKATAPSRVARTRAVRAQALLHGAQEQAQSSTLKFGVALQKIAQPLRQREDPLPQRQVRQDVIGEMRRRRHHTPGVARWAHAPALAGEQYQEVVAALPAPRAGEAQGCAFPGAARALHACPLVERGGSSVVARGAGGHWPLGLGCVAEVRWLRTGQRRGIASCRSPRQFFLTGRASSMRKPLRRVNSTRRRWSSTVIALIPCALEAAKS
jgi:hypothetical protein